MSTEWEAVRPFVEPAVAEVNQPDSVLLELRLTLFGDGRESSSATFANGVTFEQRLALLDRAQELAREHRVGHRSAPRLDESGS